MNYFLICFGAVLLARPRLFWRQNPRWFNTGLVQLLFPQRYDLIMRVGGGVFAAIGILSVAGVLK